MSLREAGREATKVSDFMCDGRRKVHEALTEELAKRVDVDVPQSVLRQLGETEYQAKLLEMQARVRPWRAVLSAWPCCAGSSSCPRSTTRLT